MRLLTGTHKPLPFVWIVVVVVVVDLVVATLIVVRGGIKISGTMGIETRIEDSLSPPNGFSVVSGAELPVVTLALGNHEPFAAALSAGMCLNMFTHHKRRPASACRLASFPA